MKTKLAIVAALLVVGLSSAQPAAASWQLIPGKPYDGHIGNNRMYKEPCWSAASSKCSLERSGGKWMPNGSAVPKDSLNEARTERVRATNGRRK
jgi:hypothetical protein